MDRLPLVPIGFANPDRRAIDREKDGGSTSTNPLKNLPPESELNLVLPAAYPKTYPGVPCGCWSGDGSQLLCLLQTLQDHQGDLDLAAFARQLLAWRDKAWHQSGGTVFDCGSATGTVLDRVRAGVPASVEGEGHDRSQGNGSLMRALPAALLPVLWRQDPGRAIAVAMKQNRVTHLYPLAQVCCAVYAQFRRFAWPSR